jgi:hypothetical protein
MELKLQVKAKLKILFGFPIHKGIRRTSGGIGKKIDSVNEISDNAYFPEVLLAQLRTQS